MLYSPGLQFVRTVKLSTQQSELQESQVIDDDGLSSAIIGDVGSSWKFNTWEVCEIHSYFLNSMIRILLARLPANSLKHFSWDHQCCIDTVTLDLLFKRHGGGLPNLGFRLHRMQKRGTDLWQKGLTSLQIADIKLQDEDWPIRLLVCNYDSLRHLKIGVESEIERQYAETGQLEANLSPSLDWMSLLYLLVSNYCYLTSKRLGRSPWNHVLVWKPPFPILNLDGL